MVQKESIAVEKIAIVGAQKINRVCACCKGDSNSMDIQPARIQKNIISASFQAEH